MTNELKKYFQNLFPNTATERIVLPYAGELEIIQNIIYPNTIKRMRPGKDEIGQKMPGGVKYIVIHDTGMARDVDTAAGIASYAHAQANSIDGRVASWHYTVDEKEIYQHVPDDEIAWHAGDGSRAYGTTYFNDFYQTYAIGGGNQNGIGIETCINDGGNYQLTLMRTAKLVAKLLVKHNLGLDAVKQHRDFSGKDCPAVIRSTYGRWEEFLKHVEFQLNILKNGGNVFFNFEIDNLNAIDSYGIVNSNILTDEIVHIKLVINAESNDAEYNYQITVKASK